MVAKAVAVTQGPTGLGYQSLMMSAASVCLLVGLLGVPQAVPRIAPQWDSGAWSLVAAIARGLAVSLPVPLAVALWFVIGEGSPPFGTWILGLGFLAMVMGSLVALLLPPLVATFTSPMAAGRRGLVAALVTSLVAVPLVLVLPFEWLPVALGVGVLVGQVASLMTLGSATRNWAYEKHSSSVTVFRQAWATFPSYVLTGLGLGVLPLLFVSVSGAVVGGLYRSAFTLGTLPALLLFPLIATVFFTRVSRLTVENPESVDRFTRERLWRIGVLGALGSMCLASLAPLAIVVAYSREFLSTSFALGIFLSGGLLRLSAWHFTFLLQAHGKLRAYFVVEAATLVVLVVPSFLAAKSGSVELAAVAFATAYVANLLVAFYFCRRHQIGSWSAIKSGWPLYVGALLCPLLAFGAERFFRVF